MDMTKHRIHLFWFKILLLSNTLKRCDHAIDDLKEYENSSCFSLLRNISGIIGGVVPYYPDLTPEFVDINLSCDDIQLYPDVKKVEYVLVNSTHLFCADPLDTCANCQCCTVPLSFSGSTVCRHQASALYEWNLTCDDWNCTLSVPRFNMSQVCGTEYDCNTHSCFARWAYVHYVCVNKSSITTAMTVISTPPYDSKGVSETELTEIKQDKNSVMKTNTTGLIIGLSLSMLINCGLVIVILLIIFRRKKANAGNVPMDNTYYNMTSGIQHQWLQEQRTNPSRREDLGSPRQDGTTTNDLVSVQQTYNEIDKQIEIVNAVEEPRSYYNVGLHDSSVGMLHERNVDTTNDQSNSDATLECNAAYMGTTFSRNELEENTNSVNTYTQLNLGNRN